LRAWLPTSERSIAVLLFCAALGLRLWFTAHESGDALYWDEDHYDVTAASYARAWRALVDDQPAAPAWSAAFSLSRQKGETYAVFAGLVYAVADSSPRAVFVAQALLDALTCVFLFVVARRLAGGTAGLLAFAFAAAYEPFVFSAARLQTETLASFLLMGACAALCGRSRRVAPFIAGLLLAVSMLAKPAFKFLGPLWLPFVAYGLSPGGRRRRYAAALLLILGFFLVIGPRLALTHSLFGEAAWTGDLDPGVHVYAGAIPEDGGWRTMGYQPSGELLEVLGPSDRYPTSADYWRAAVRTWRYHPGASTMVALHKLYRAWLHPYNDSGRQLLFVPSVLQGVHGLLLLLGFFGMPLVARRGAIGWALILTAAYLWGNYLAVAIEVRYAVSAMPLMLCFAAVTCADLGAAWKRTTAAGHLRVLVTMAAAAMLAAAVEVFTIGRLLGLVDGLSPIAAHALRTAMMMIIVLLVGGAVVVLLRRSMSNRLAAVSVTLPSVLAMSVLVVGATQTQAWRQWSTPLATGGRVAAHEIQVPAATLAPAHLNLLIDVKRTCAAPFDLVIRINGREAHRFRQGLGDPTSVLLKVDDFNQILRAQKRTGESMPGWRMIALDPNSVTERRLRIEVEVESGPPGVACVELFGDYQDDNGYIGPAVLSPWRQEHASVYRYLVAGDDRMRRRTQISASSAGAVGRDGVWSRDLSPEVGVQSGRFRIFLVLTYAGSRSIF
jgi:hypothetical protein